MPSVCVVSDQDTSTESIGELCFSIIASPAEALLAPHLQREEGLVQLSARLPLQGLHLGLCLLTGLQQRLQLRAQPGVLTGRPPPGRQALCEERVCRFPVPRCNPLLILLCSATQVWSALQWTASSTRWQGRADRAPGASFLLRAVKQMHSTGQKYCFICRCHA